MQAGGFEDTCGVAFAGAILDRRGVDSAAALQSHAGTAGALGVSGRLFGRVRRRGYKTN